MKRLIPPPGARVGAVAVLVIAMLFAALISWSVSTSKSDETICQKIDKLDAALIRFVQKPVVPDKPGQPGYRYYHDIAPDEAQALRSGKGADALLALLRQAACDPKNLPTGG